MFHNFIQANHRQMVVMILLFFFLFQVQEHGLDHYPIKGEDCEDESAEGNEQVRCGQYAY